MSFTFILRTALSLLVPLTIGFLLVSVVWGKSRRVPGDFVLKCSLAVGFGFGAVSCLSFACAVLMGQLGPGIIACEVVVILGLGLVVARRKRTFAVPTGSTAGASVNCVDFRRPIYLRLAVCAASLSGALRFVSLSRQNPHGQFDAFAIWNLHARFLYGGGRYWKNFVDIKDHSDYPFLLPGAIGGSWELAGKQTQLIPIATALLFTIATIAVVAASISRLRGERQGLLAALLLLSTPFLISHGASQYADVPLSFFIAATGVFLLLHAESSPQTHFLVLGGMSAAFSAWTKNEGALYLGLLILFHLLVTVLVQGTNTWFCEIRALILGAAPIIAVIIIYKFAVAGRNDIIAAQGITPTVLKFLDFSRYRIISSEFARESLSFGGWRAGSSVPTVLVFYLLLLGVRLEKKHRAAASVLALLLLSMLAGYFLVYIVSPLDLRFHLESSLSRLLLQIWPLLVLLYFMVVRTPEHASAGAVRPDKTEPLCSGSMRLEPTA